MKHHDPDLYGRLTQLGYRGGHAPTFPGAMTDTGTYLRPDFEFLSMPPSDDEVREKERPDFRWPVQGELSSDFYNPPDSVIRRAYIKPVPTSVDQAMGLFQAGYRQLIERFASGDLTAWGTLHEGAPDLPISCSLWLSKETKADWVGNELLPRSDQRIKIQRIDVQSPEYRGEKGAPRKYSWDEAIALLREEMVSGWRPRTGNQLAEKVVEKLLMVGSKAPKDLKQVTTHLKTHEPELWENVKQR
ncbi:hypothetical protein [Roseibium sp.]|uniref:hypothetical protein n=1 Tax=Roseibium sp. TaxID=1936156 RepID=UPI003B51379E